MPGGEQEVSESGVVAKVRREMERDSERKKVAEDVAGLKDDMKGVKDFCKRFPELCHHLEEKVDSIERKPSEPQHIWLAGKETKHPATDLLGLYSCCDSDDPKSCPTKSLCAEIPDSLQAKMFRHFAKNPGMVKKLEAQGFQLDGEGYREKYKGMLGG